MYSNAATPPSVSYMQSSQLSAKLGWTQNKLQQFLNWSQFTCLYTRHIILKNLRNQIRGTGRKMTWKQGTVKPRIFHKDGRPWATWGSMYNPLPTHSHRYFLVPYGLLNKIHDVNNKYLGMNYLFWLVIHGWGHFWVHFCTIYFKEQAHIVRCNTNSSLGNL